jgi:hypothetical protein
VSIAEQLSIVLRASVPLYETEKAWLYQPFESAARLGVADTDGAVASRLIVTDFESEPPVLVAEHVNVAPEVSEVTLLGPQPVCEVTVESGSVTVQVTETLLVYQPLFPSVPVIVGVITGGVVSQIRVTVTLAGAVLPATSVARALITLEPHDKP